MGCWREWQERTPACRALPEVRLGQGGRRWEGLPSALQRPGSHAVGSAMVMGGMAASFPARATPGISSHPHLIGWD